MPPRTRMEFQAGVIPASAEPKAGTHAHRMERALAFKIGCPWVPVYCGVDHALA